MTELEQIYKRYFKDVYFFVYRLCKDKSIAEDITSETFFKAIKSIDSFRGDSDIRTWLCQIAKNLYISYLRKNNKVVSQDDFNFETTDEVDVEKIVLSSDEAMRLHRILHQLSEPYKEVFTLRVFGELTFKQIASIFGKTDNWACVTFHRAKQKIKEEMRDAE